MVIELQKEVPIEGKMPEMREEQQRVALWWVPVSDFQLQGHHFQELSIQEQGLHAQYVCL